jgi:diphthamide biosynthesis protein 7
MRITSRKGPATLPQGDINTMQSIKHFQSLKLDLTPSCIEFCTRYPQYAVVGTYSLEKTSEEQSVGDDCQKESQQRKGSLILLRVVGDQL